jgi:hypothetical protein
MKTIETKLYSFKELSPEAQDRVIEREAQRIHEDPDNFTLLECIASLKAVASALGLRLKDWNIGPYNRNNHASVNSDESGNKAIAEFVKCLIRHGYARKPKFKDMLVRGTGSFIGVCGFTGVCFDDDICEEILEALLDGETMSKAFGRAADRIMRICEDDLEYRTSRAGILDYLDTTDEIYTEDGNEF